EMINELLSWIDRYPLVAVEEGLADDDWAGWADFRSAAPGRATRRRRRSPLHEPGQDSPSNRGRIRQRASPQDQPDRHPDRGRRSATLARSAGWRVILSARSGETEDSWLSDLAVWGARSD